MAFNFADFLLYSNSQNIDETSYATIAKGVLGTLQNVYNLHLENTTEGTQTEFLINGSTLDLTFGPVNSITDITQDGVSQPFTWFGRDIKFTTTITDLDTPVVVTGDFGYVSIPDDLKLAVYRHIESVHFATTNHTDDVSKIVNTTGNTTFFRTVDIPDASKRVYDYYSPRQIVL